jgi:hypothetical protein
MKLIKGLAVVAAVAGILGVWVDPEGTADTFKMVGGHVRAGAASVGHFVAELGEDG